MTTITRPRLLRRSLVFPAGALAVVSALALVVTGGAQAEDQPPPIAVEVLSTTSEEPPILEHNEFTDDVAVQVRDKPEGRSTEVINLRDASRMAVFKFTIQPGAMFPWHTHPGPVFAAVAEGELTYTYADDCVPRPYHRGEAFVDPGLVHTAKNSGDEPTVVIATVFGLDEGASPSTFIRDLDELEALNECTSAPPPPPLPQ